MRSIRSIGRGSWAPPGGVLIWLDATTGVVHSGATFTSWTDRVNGHVFTVAGGSAAYSATAWAGAKPGVTLAVSALDCADAGIASYAGAYTAVATVDMTGSGGRMLCCWNTASLSYGFGISTVGTAHVLERVDPTTDALSSGGSRSVQGRNRWGITDTSTTSGSGVISTWASGVADLSAVAISARAASPTSFRLGCNIVGASSFTGVLSELIIWNRILPTSDILAYHNAFSPAKWGL